MSDQQPTGSMIDAETRAITRAQEHRTTTGAPVRPQRITALALAALLLALGFATGRATDRFWPASRAGSAPAAVRQSLASDSYTPNAMDYREERRAYSPADLPDTPRLQPQLARLDARDYGPADNGAPPPQDDGHNPGPR